MNRRATRTATRWEGRSHGRLGLSLVIAAACLALLAGCGGAATLTGTDLGQQPAPDFALTDQRGDAVRLSDFRGKAVVLTFIYTTCPDICPRTAESLRAAYEQLPEATRGRVALLAVTVDPERDTPAALRSFSARHGLDGNPGWFALTADRATLEPVWRDYGIDPGTMLSRSPLDRNAPAPRSGAPATPALLDILAHTDAVYVIDPAGRERVLLRSDLDPAALAADLRTLTA